MNIIAGDLFTHLSVCAENPDFSDRKRSLYKQALLELEGATEFFATPSDHVPDLEGNLTGNVKARIGVIFYSIFVLESQPDDEEVSLTDE